jgi:iodotyrosine deiodinase
MGEPRFMALDSWTERTPEEMQRRAQKFYEHMNRRRSVRQFSDRPIPEGVIENCLRTAGTAPSGAHKQPWHFVAVRDPAVKRKIRLAAEEEEGAFYGGRAPNDWLAALAPLGTDERKPFLETAPCLIAVFARSFGRGPDGEKEKHYYVQESVGIATGFLIAALHGAGLVTLTHTPSPMGFLNQLLGRPKEERPFLLLVTGYPAVDARVPNLSRSPLSDISTFI